MANKEWFREAKFGMMIHFGVYSLLGGEWNYQRIPYLGEWAQSYFRIPNSEYEKLAKAFNPILFDAEEWVRLALDAGMKYVVVTSKHHDGFALFKSDFDGYNIVGTSVFGRDIVAELAEACRRHGLRFGLYYSQELDWHEPDGGGYGPYRCFGNASRTNEWDFPDESKKDFSRCFNGKIKTQIAELLTKYGDISLLWCDCPFIITPEQSRELYELVKSLQPDCLVNSRIGNGLGDYHSWDDNFISDAYMTDGLYETPATMNDTWGWKSFDNNWKSPERIIELKRHLNDRGINYLLNVGPDHLGRIPSPSAEILRRVGEIDRENK